MNLNDLASFALQRVAAHDGLAIDAGTWTDAHAYHQTAQRFHARVLHGTGIVAGLRVVATEPASRAVILQPGVAIDHDGNVVRVPQPLRLEIPSAEPGALCLALRFAESPVDAGNGNPPNRVAEAYQFLAYPPPVPPLDVEVARIDIQDARSSIGPAADEWEPAAGEIDMRFRRELRPQTTDTLTIGQLALADQSLNGIHRLGLINLVHDLAATAPFVTQFIGDVKAEDAAGQCDLLYISGAGEWRPTPREGAHVLAYLRGGGIAFAEPCAELESKKQENGRFVSSFQRLMSDLKYGLTELSPSHRLFRSRYVFGLPPEGASGHAKISGRDNIILNPNDYGCCMQGGMTGTPLGREIIRGATEFATNVAWYAAGSSTRTVTPVKALAGKAVAESAKS